VAEEGAGTGLTIGFDNWDATGENAPAIDVKWAGAILPGGHRLVAKHNYGAYIPVAVELSSDGRLDLDINGTNVFRDLPTPYQPIAGARLGLAARTGGSVANHWYDDLCISLFNGGPVSGQRLVPEVVEVCAQPLQPVGVHPVDAAGPHLLVCDQPRLLQHLKMLRDGRAAHGQLTGQLADGARPVGEPLEDRAPRRVTERGQTVGSVSLHER